MVSFLLLSRKWECKSSDWKHFDENGENDYTYFIFEYGGTNGFGAMIKDEAIFKDGEYIMDYDEDIDEDDYDYNEKSKVKLDLLEYEYYVEFEGAPEDGSWKRIDINVKKIKKKMGLS